MRAAVYHGIDDIKVEELPDLEPGPGEFLMQIAAAGICGTDLRILANGHHRIPAGTRRILGHELSGKILKVGVSVSQLKPGARVGVAPNIGCGTCSQCRTGWTNLCEDYSALGISLDGGFAEEMLVPEAAIRQGNVVAIPDHLSYAAAALAEPLSCCINGQEAVHIGPDDVVIVVGAGPIGIMHLLLAKMSGARTVIVSELLPARLEMAAACGADIAVDPSKENLHSVIADETAGDGASAIVVASAAPRAQAQALELAARRGRINFFGGLPRERSIIQIDSNLIHYKQLVVTGTTGSNVRQYHAAVNLLAEGRIELDSLISAILPLNKIHEGIERARSGQEMRILVDPSA